MRKPIVDSGLRRPHALASAAAVFVVMACAVTTTTQTGPAGAQWAAEADSVAAMALFRENIDAIHKRDRTRYIATYLNSPRLVVNGPSGPQIGYEGFLSRQSSTWPDTLIATDLRVVPIASDVVYGSYRYDVRYGDSTSTGVSERVFVRTPAGWRIAVTSAFGSPLAYRPRP